MEIDSNFVIGIFVITAILYLGYYLLNQHFVTIYTSGAAQRHISEFSGTNQRPYGHNEDFSDRRRKEAYEASRQSVYGVIPNPDPIAKIFTYMEKSTPELEGDLQKKMLFENKIIS